MSKMDYKEKYEQALGWMQSLYNGLHGKTKEEAEHFFPELKESEDELMRKEAIAIIKQYNIICEREGDKCYTADRVIAWLEKQGQRKTIDEQSDTCDTCENDELYAGKPTDYTKSNRKKCEEISELDWSGEAPEDRIYQAAYIMAEWKDDKAVELYTQELRQFRNLLIKINPDAKDLINIEQSINEFRNALNL